jgi:hypothetical protein
MQYTIKCQPRVPWNVFDRVCLCGLEVSNFFIAICMLQFLSQYAYCDMQYACNMHIACHNIDSFVLNQKGLV